MSYLVLNLVLVAWFDKSELHRVKYPGEGHASSCGFSSPPEACGFSRIASRWVSAPDAGQGSESNPRAVERFREGMGGFGGRSDCLIQIVGGGGSCFACVLKPQAGTGPVSF